jgi:hypothetical protein
MHTSIVTGLVQYCRLMPLDAALVRTLWRDDGPYRQLCPRKRKHQLLRPGTVSTPITVSHKISNISYPEHETSSFPGLTQLPPTFRAEKPWRVPPILPCKHGRNSTIFHDEVIPIVKANKCYQIRQPMELRNTTQRVRSESLSAIVLASLA